MEIKHVFFFSFFQCDRCKKDHLETFGHCQFSRASSYGHSKSELGFQCPLYLGVETRRPIFAELWEPLEFLDIWRGWRGGIKRKILHFLLTSRWELEQSIGKSERYRCICVLSLEISSRELRSDTYFTISRTSVSE